MRYSVISDFFPLIKRKKKKGKRKRDLVICEGIAIKSTVRASSYHKLLIFMMVDGFLIMKILIKFSHFQMLYRGKRLH